MCSTSINQPTINSERQFDQTSTIYQNETNSAQTPLIEKINLIFKPLVEQIEWMKKKFDTPCYKTFASVILIGKSLNGLASNITKIDNTILLKILTAVQIEEIKRIFGEIGKYLKVFSLLSLIAIPVSIYALDKQCKAIQKTKDIYEAVLGAISTCNDIIKAPGAVADVVGVFTPISNTIWNIASAALSGISLVFSIGSIVTAARSHWVSKNFVQKYERKSNEVLVKHLRENFKDAEFLSKIDQELKFEVDILLNNLPENASAKELEYFVEALKTTLSQADPELLKTLENVANMAYLDCLTNKNGARKDAKLSKQFQTDIPALKDQINKIKDAFNNKEENSAENLKKTVDNLKKRVAYKKLNDIVTALSSSVSVVASALFLTISILAIVGTVCPPLAFVAYPLLILIGIVAIVKIWDNYKNKKMFEDEMGLTQVRLTKEIAATQEGLKTLNNLETEKKNTNEKLKLFFIRMNIKFQKNSLEKKMTELAGLTNRSK